MPMPARLNHSAWFIALGLALALFAIALPVRQAQLAALSPASVPGGWSRAGWQAALNEVGLGPEFFASYQLAFEIVLAGTLAVAATVVVRQRGADPIGLLT